jgi:hypothetical protein
MIHRLRSNLTALQARCITQYFVRVTLLGYNPLGIRATCGKSRHTRLSYKHGLQELRMIDLSINNVGDVKDGGTQTHRGGPIIVHCLHKDHANRKWSGVSPLPEMPLTPERQHFPYMRIAASAVGIFANPSSTVVMYVRLFWVFPCCPHLSNVHEAPRFALETLHRRPPCKV